MNVHIESSWKSRLEAEFNKPYFQELTEFVRKEYKEHDCYPKGSNIFAAFDHSPFNEVKVVIIGQDPYHGAGQANGLCFSVRDGMPHPPSLINIFRELERDLGKPYPKSGNLEHWASQGVLLLNATLTVRANQAASHQNKGWEAFTDAVITTLSGQSNGIVFMLWGGYAKRKKALIDTAKHFVLTSGHPSPLSANRGLWFGNGHFSRANEILKMQRKAQINW